MKKIFFAAALAASVFSAPAMARDFTGLRAEVTAGWDDAINNRDVTDVTYGVTVGVDAEVTDKVIAGLELNADNVFDRRDLGVSARVGYAFNDTVMAYGKVGYANFEDAARRKLDGLRVGGGLELNVTDNIFTGVEYRYTDFERNVGKHGVVARIGYRF